MAPLLIPIGLTIVGIAADYYIRRDAKEAVKVPEVVENADSVVVVKDTPLTIGEWIDEMPKQTKTIAVVAIAGALAIARKKGKL